jgi:pimeloyl-ACP methyl ester carboxylesterase
LQHPFSKRDPVKSRLSEDVFKKCVKQEEYCPQAKFVMFEKSGHNPQIEEPSKLFSFIESFLN